MPLHLAVVLTTSELRHSCFYAEIVLLLKKCCFQLHFLIGFSVLLANSKSWKCGHYNLQFCYSFDSIYSNFEHFVLPLKLTQTAQPVDLSFCKQNCQSLRVKMIQTADFRGAFLRSENSFPVCYFGQYILQLCTAVS